jgi:hypothetical protein
MSEDEERVAFEAWARKHVTGTGDNNALGEFWLDRLDDGRYEWTRLQDVWQGWLGRSKS